MIVRADLTPGLKLAQACHAAAQICLDKLDNASAWQKQSNNLVVLEVADEQALKMWAFVLKFVSLPVSSFHEPDLDDQLTSVASFVPEDLCRILRELPLAGGVMPGGS